MKKQGLRISALILLVVVGLMGCKKDSRSDEAVADVYIKSVLNDGQPVFGLAHYVFGYSAIKSVSVNMPDQTMDQLNPYDETGTVFYSEPTPMNGSYSSVIPAKGTYNYGVKFTDGVEKVFKDELEDKYLLPPDITSISKSADNSKVTLKWATLTGAEYYQFTIKKTGLNVYSSQVFAITSSENYLDIPLSIIPSFSAGTYTFELNAFKYHSVNKSSLQAVSTASADIDL
jgi:hypothetical protein